MTNMLRYVAYINITVTNVGIHYSPADKQPVIQTPDTPHASSISKKSTQSSKGLQLDNSKIKVRDRGMCAVLE